ncbi:RHS repeat-associated core domain-containing protein [Clostridium sp.]|uniref:RHS repeat-associated core domain-containing protein n=1 Tax=Clostridium sp. TaxID=1506 RepID=UPI003216DA2A
MTGDKVLGEKNPYRYRGYRYDNETGYYYLQSRYYNPDMGRFINADILISIGHGLIGNNIFAYCLNNPTSNRDDNEFLCFAMADGGGRLSTYTGTTSNNNSGFSYTKSAALGTLSGLGDKVGNVAARAFVATVGAGMLIDLGAEKFKDYIYKR